MTHRPLTAAALVLVLAAGAPAHAAADPPYDIAYRITLDQDSGGGLRSCRLQLVGAPNSGEVWELFLSAGKGRTAGLSAKVSALDAAQGTRTPLKALAATLSVQGQKVPLTEPQHHSDGKTLGYLMDARFARQVIQSLDQSHGSVEFAVRGGPTAAPRSVRGTPKRVAGSATVSQCLAGLGD